MHNYFCYVHVAMYHIFIQLGQYPKNYKFLKKNTFLLENIKEDIQEIPNHHVYFVLVVNAREKSIEWIFLRT